jgi:hypothetical protein
MYFKLLASSQLDDIVGNEPIVERLKIIAEEGNMNNMILAVRHRAGSSRGSLNFRGSELWTVIASGCLVHDHRRGPLAPERRHQCCALLGSCLEPL